MRWCVFSLLQADVVSLVKQLARTMLLKKKHTRTHTHTHTHTQKWQLRRSLQLLDAANSEASHRSRRVVPALFPAIVDGQTRPVCPEPLLTVPPTCRWFSFKSQPKQPAATAAGAGGVAQQVSTLGEFHSAASSIAKSIHKVSQKLEHLTKRE